MRIRCLSLLAFPLWAAAQSTIPTINPDGIVRADNTRSPILPPGMVFSIWGHGYGPHDGCKGSGTEACRVQVLLDGTPIEVQYTNDVLINARMPDASPNQPVSHLVVVSSGLRSVPVEVRRMPENAVISLDGVARVDGPVWIHVDLSRGLGVSYPSMARPWDFACDGFEVRRNGNLLPPIPHPMLGMIYSGPPCPGTAGLSDGKSQSRLPLHLQYRFNEPGTYEVRLTHYGDFGRRADDVRIQSDWTPIHVLPSTPRAAIGLHPQEPSAVVRDFLPTLLARPDDEALNILLEYLYHASPRVRSYAADALYYWPDAIVEPRLLATLHANGPSPVVAARLKAHVSEVVAASMDYFFSDDPVLFQGAIAAARLALAEDSEANTQLRARVEERLTALATGNLWRTDGQTTIDIIALLGQIHTERVHNLLWNLADHHTGGEQALIAITWQKDPKDLPRLTDFLLAQPVGEKGEPSFSSLPNLMHNSFGDAALPSLRAVLEKARPVSLRLRCAEELMRANDPAGFAFAVDAIEHGREWKLQVREFANNQFPDARNMTDADLTKLLTDHTH